MIADHGMSDKANDNGDPNVIWLQDILDVELGEGACTVICPITDAFVGHHGALGGFVRIYITGGAEREKVIEIAQGQSGIKKVWTAEEIAEELEQPLDREGDVAVMGDKRTVIGGRAVDHDLSALKGRRLRTHGSLYEANVPFIISEPLTGAYAERMQATTLRSHEIFDYVLNGVT